MDRGRIALTLASALMLACGSDSSPVVETEGDTETGTAGSGDADVATVVLPATAWGETLPRELRSGHDSE